MQAIQTKYLPATDRRGSRVKAACERGSIIIDYPHDLSGDEVHREAVRQLVARFIEEDKVKHASHPAWNPWRRPFVTGGMPDGSYAHVFVV